MATSKEEYPHRQQQIDWFKAWVQGDSEAGSQLLASCERLIWSIANRFFANASAKQRMRCDLEDLVQVGRLGLWEKMHEFDPTRGVLFGTFARFKIQGAISWFLLKQRPNSSNTKDSRKLYYKFGKTRTLLEAQGIVPTDALIARYLNLNQGEVAVQGFRIGMQISLDQDEAARHVESGIADPFSMTLHRTRSDAVQGCLRQFLSGLDEQEKTIFQAYTIPYLLEEDYRTLRDLAKEFGLSHEGVRKVGKRIEKRFMDFCITKGVHEFLVP